MSIRAPRESRHPERRPFATGLVYKKGKFSAIEAQQIAGAIEAYKEVSSRFLQAWVPLMVTYRR